MTELYLIAHKVRGEPAFDIAEHMICPKCTGQGWVANADTCEGFHCSACDGAGHWWIIPTSGHRAFPYWDYKLMDLFAYPNVGNPPENLRDHYTTEREAAKSLVDLLGLIHKPLAPVNIKRRL